MHLLAWVDGGARGNPGPAGYGVLLKDESGGRRIAIWGFLGSTTNNVAEYNGLLEALRTAQALGASSILVHTDSELLQRQYAGVYKVRQPHLIPLMAEARRLAAGLGKVEVRHVRREQNREADALANRAMDERASGRLEAPLS